MGRSKLYIYLHIVRMGVVYPWEFEYKMWEDERK